MNKIIKLFGAIDLLFISWLVISSVINGSIPFYTGLLDDIKSSGGFAIWAVSFTILAHLVKVSIIASGYLLIKERKLGAYVALMQFPFRLLLIIPPTFFFFSALKSIIPSFAIVIITLLIVLEVAKVLILLKWLRNSKRSEN